MPTTKAGRPKLAKASSLAPLKVFGTIDDGDRPGFLGEEAP